ncbi:carbonic anhydrase [uncultured Pseudokineococcus sp.]|uniref:carbonic anhydrase n=1 Tax=uncultured Pseudokineococcus sp. TaxID=1642928 RepID=UPI002605F854|nr:carbonic anhydrase [uncultured Pseudokineococcus sp.]
MPAHQTPPTGVPAPRTAPGTTPGTGTGPGPGAGHEGPGAWLALLGANARWAQGRSGADESRSPLRRAAFVGSQAPVAAVLGCSDSRVPVELVLDQGVGDLFVVRTAGHALDTTVLGSLEYAVGQLGVGLVVVLGHEGCGALAAAGAVLDGAPRPPGALGEVVDALLPAVRDARRRGARTPLEVTHHHAGATAQLLQRSALLGAAHERGAVEVVAASYSLSTGLVTAAVGAVTAGAAG